MAEEYVIRIKADGDAQSGNRIPLAVPGDNGVNTPQSQSQSPAPTGAGGSSGQLSKMVVTGALVPAVTAVASTAVGSIGLATGNNKLQQRVNIAMSAASKAGGLWSSVAGGSAIGGPVGAAVGAAVWAMGQATEVATTVIKHHVEYNNECQRLGVLRDRAGIATDRRR